MYHQMEQHKSDGLKSLAILIDPDGGKAKNLGLTVDLANNYNIDFFFVGGSLLIDDEIDETVSYLKANTNRPIILFPGNEIQIHPDADALLFLSLISGRNPEYLIGKHVVAAPLLKRLKMEVIPTGYLLVQDSLTSTASYITNTTPIPINKPEIAVATAMAGEMLGQKLIYLEGGSGTPSPIPSTTISQVSKAIDIPLIVGGGIRTPEKLKRNYMAGADIQVVGTAFESEPELIREFAMVKKEINEQMTKV